MSKRQKLTILHRLDAILIPLQNQTIELNSSNFTVEIEWVIQVYMPIRQPRMTLAKFGTRVEDGFAILDAKFLLWHDGGLDQRDSNVE